MQEKRHDRVVEMRLCFFLGKVGDYNVSFVETRMCRSTLYKIRRIEIMPHFPDWFVAICVLLPVSNVIYKTWKNNKKK